MSGSRTATLSDHFTKMNIIPHYRVIHVTTLTHRIVLKTKQIISDSIIQKTRKQLSSPKSSQCGILTCPDLLKIYRRHIVPCKRTPIPPRRPFIHQRLEKRVQPRRKTYSSPQHAASACTQHQPSCLALPYQYLQESNRCRCSLFPMSHSLCQRSGLCIWCGDNAPIHTTSKKVWKLLKHSNAKQSPK